MSIQRINTNLTLEAKIQALNDMILELNGKVAAAQFDKNEITSVILDSSLDREFYRDANVGNTLATYSGWEHVYAKLGYSIWKITPTNYAYDPLNQLYINSKLLTNTGEALSEASLAFDKVELYNGDSGSGYIDNTTEAGLAGGTEFELMNSTTDYLYIGHASVFNGLKIEFQTRGSNYTLVFEYYNGAWVEFTPTDNTSNFLSDGNIIWTDEDVDSWATVAIDGTTQYWIRISTSIEPITTAEAYWIVHSASVEGLLALSSSQISNEEWAWCSYNNTMYVTIRNAGNPSYEGDYFISSSSSVANKQNFFITNNPFTADYLDITYTPAALSYSVSYRDAFTDLDVSTDVLTVAHNLSKQFVTARVYNNNNQEIEADLVTATDINTLSINLSSQRPLSGTWNVVVIA
jgi:hypothetical protein